MPHYGNYANEHIIRYIMLWVEEAASPPLFYALRQEATLLQWVQPLLLSAMALGQRLLQPLYEGSA